MLYRLVEPQRLGEKFWNEALPALSETRRQKVLSFRFSQDRTLSAVAYLLLWLGLRTEYGVKTRPECLTGTHGKPYLNNGRAFFSLSHCRQAVVCAIDDEELGVDVEHSDAFSSEKLDANLMQHIFSRREQDAVCAAANPAQAACQLWTAKESVCKYTGEGLGDDLPSILYRPNIQIDFYPLNEAGLSVAVCRRAAKRSPLPCREISPEALRQFLVQQTKELPSS